MNTISLTVFGREIFTLRVTDPARAEPEPVTEAPEVEPEADDCFGFHGGSGGIHEAVWHPTTPRPIEAG